MRNSCQRLRSRPKKRTVWLALACIAPKRGAVMVGRAAEYDESWLAGIHRGLKTKLLGHLGTQTATYIDRAKIGGRLAQSGFKFVSGSCRTCRRRYGYLR